MTDIKNTIYREMVIDLLFRLRLADQQFCQVTDLLVSAMGMDDTEGRQQAVELLHAYTQTLQIIYADFLHLIDGHHITFPPDVELWQWFEPDGEKAIAHTLELLHDIAEGMELRLNTEMLKMEATR